MAKRKQDADVVEEQKKQEENKPPAQEDEDEGSSPFIGSQIPEYFTRKISTCSQFDEISEKACSEKEHLVNSIVI